MILKNVGTYILCVNCDKHDNIISIIGIKFSKVTWDLISLLFATSIVSINMPIAISFISLIYIDKKHAHIFKKCKFFYYLYLYLFPSSEIILKVLYIQFQNKCIGFYFQICWIPYTLLVFFVKKYFHDNSDIF